MDFIERLTNNKSEKNTDLFSKKNLNGNIFVKLGKLFVHFDKKYYHLENIWNFSTNFCMIFVGA